MKNSKNFQKRILKNTINSSRLKTQKSYLVVALTDTRIRMCSKTDGIQIVRQYLSESLGIIIELYIVLQDI